MAITDLAAVILAAGAVLDAWAKGEIFDALRTYVHRRAAGIRGPVMEDLAPGLTVEYPWWARVLDRVLPTFFAQAWSCLFCASYHAPAYLLALWYLPSLWLPSPWDVVWKLPIYSLAATRVVVLGNAHWNRAVEAFADAAQERAHMSSSSTKES